MDVVQNGQGGRKGDEIGSKVTYVAFCTLCVHKLICFERGVVSRLTYVPYHS